MADNKMTTNELREMLDEYSPEQQMEMNAKAISEGSKRLTDALAQIVTIIKDLSICIENLRQARTIHISEESRATIIKTGRETGDAVADAFNKRVQETIVCARKEMKCVSIPATAAYCLIYVFILFLTYTSIILVMNGYVWHNSFIWQLALLLLGIVSLLIVLTIFICKKGWV